MLVDIYHKRLNIVMDTFLQCQSKLSDTEFFKERDNIYRLLMLLYKLKRARRLPKNEMEAAYRDIIREFKR